MPHPPFRNVFILCSGRCGSTSFARACRHVANWTSGHETRSHMLGLDRLAYPPFHIEADNRLSWMLGRMDQSFGPEAAYVHLTRDPEAVAQSYARRAGYGIMHAYYHGIVFPPAEDSGDRPVIEHARDMVATITANIETFLRGKPQVMRMRLEEMEARFPDFWDWIGAEGRLDLALKEWSTRHNESVDADIMHGRTMAWSGKVTTWPRQFSRRLRLLPGHRAG